MNGRSANRILKLLLILPAAGYLGLAAFALLFAERLVFPAPPPGYSDSADIRKFTYGAGGEQVSMIYLEQPRSRYLVFYHHGNGEDLQEILPRLSGLHRAGFSVLAWDYPGYGTSDGTASAELVLEIAEKIQQALPELSGYSSDRVIQYGRSVGGGPATWLAARHGCAGLVLEGAFTSAFRVGIPVKLLPWDIFDNLSLIGSVRCPVLVMHGTADETVPFNHGVRLLEAAPAPKSFAWFAGGRHNDLVDVYPEIYYSSLERFVRSQ